jgi:hypothetical protein
MQVFFEKITNFKHYLSFKMAYSADKEFNTKIL